MPPVGFEPLIPVFEQAKRVHALDRGATRDRRTLQLMTLMLREKLRNFD
jgi:hypothetical protein